MRKRIFTIVTMFLVSGLLGAAAVFAQQAEKKDDGIVRMKDGSYRSADLDASQRPDDSYLAKFHAVDDVEKLMKRNLEDIYLLNVIKSNYPSKTDWEAKYKECMNGYKDALEQYYKRNVIYACDKLRKNQETIRSLYDLIIKDYQKQCEDLLNECAGKVLLLHLDVSSRIDPDKNDALLNNHLRLRVAYGQLDDAYWAVRNNNPSRAVYHLRMARSYGIAILEDLAADANEKKSIHDKYKIDKADNLNRIYAREEEEKKKLMEGKK